MMLMNEPLLTNGFSRVTCLDFSGDNMLVAAGTQDSYIRVWTLDGSPIPAPHSDITGQDSQPQNSRRLYGHSGPVYAVSFAPATETPENAPVRTNSRWLLSSSADKTIRLWSLDLWQCMVIYKGHLGPVWDLTWGPFGHYFLSGSSDRTARLWVTDRVRQQRLFVGHEQDVDCVCFHPNSAYVFTGSSGADRTVRMWAVTTGNPVRMFAGHAGNVTAMACSNDGRLLASADDQGAIYLWDLASAKLSKKMLGHGKGGIWSLSWSAESSVLVSCGADNTVRVWDVQGSAADATNGGATPAAITAGASGAGDTPSAEGASTQGSSLAGHGDKSGSNNSTNGGSSSGGGGGSGGGVSGVNTASAGKKKGKQVVVTPDQISVFPTKKSPVYKVRFTGMNLVVAGSAYMP